MLKYLQHLNDKADCPVDVFYSDNCYGQQKNNYMMAMYKYAVTTLKKIYHAQIYSEGPQPKQGGFGSLNH